MRLVEYRFDNLEELKRAYDPALVSKAATYTVRQLQSKVGTIVSRSVRDKYNISASAMKSALKMSKVIEQGGVPVGYLIYLSKRISLSYFATGARPKIKSARGVRLGARTKVYKRERAKIEKGAFFGTGITSGSAQIFVREKPWTPYPRKLGLGPNPLTKRTAPSISQMVGGDEPLSALDKLIRDEADTKFAQNLEHFMQKQMGLR